MLAGFARSMQPGDSRIAAISTAAGPPAESDQPDPIVEPGRGAGCDGPPDIAAA